MFGLYLGWRVRRCIGNCHDQQIMAISISKCFVFLTVPISVYHTYDHLTNFLKPRLQSQIVRIIWMVPVYSLEAMLSIIYYNKSFYFQTIRELYESYVIYCFMRYLLNYLGDERHLSVRFSSKTISLIHHKAPFCYLPPWQMGNEFLFRCKTGVFQYVLVRLLLTVMSLVLYVFHWYEEGNYSLNSAFLYVTLVNACSQWWALYSLFLFYHCFEADLQSVRPVAKILCIKLVVFFCWWQSIFIGSLVRLGHISGIERSEKGSRPHSAQEVANGVQDLLISMEMLFASIGFLHSFPVLEFQTKTKEKSRVGGEEKPIPSKWKIDSIREFGKTFLSWRGGSDSLTHVPSSSTHAKQSTEEPSLLPPAPSQRPSTPGLHLSKSKTEKSIDSSSALSLKHAPELSDCDRGLESSGDSNVADMRQCSGSSGGTRTRSASDSRIRKYEEEENSDEGRGRTESESLLGYSESGQSLCTKQEQTQLETSGVTKSDTHITSRARKQHPALSVSMTDDFLLDDGESAHFGEDGSKQGPSQTLLQALWLSSVPAELHEDLSDLGTQVLDSYFGTYFAMKKWKKGSNAIS